MPREEAEAEARDSHHSARAQAHHHLHISTDMGDIRSDSRIARLSEQQLMERAERQVQKSYYSDDEIPDPRTLTTVRSPSTQRDERAGTTLPVVEEGGEIVSSDLLAHDHEPETLFANGTTSSPIGGWPPPTPPTPPRDIPAGSSLLKVNIPILPMPQFSSSPLPLGPFAGSST